MAFASMDVSGMRMHWVARGEGPPVIFLHGLPTSALLWRYVLPEVDGARCLAWDMVGYGRGLQEGRGRDLSLAAQADYMLEWMDAMEIDRAVLVGHELGGGVAQIAAVHHPKRVSGLILIDSVCYDSWPIPSVRLLRSLGPLLRRAPRFLLSQLLRLILLRGHETRAQAAKSHEVHFHPYDWAGGGAALARQIEALDSSDTLAIAPRLPGLDVPARVLWGARDPFQRRAHGDRLAADLDAQLEVVPDGRHFLPEDQPQHVVRAIEGVLRS